VKHTIADIRSEYDRLDTICGVDTRQITLDISTRAIKRLGCFRPGPQPLILISDIVLEDDTLFWDTIRHEYAHALVWLHDPRGRHGHDAAWKSACKLVGCTPRATVSTQVIPQESRASKANWRLICLGCGQETLYLREGKIVRLIRSGQSRNVTCTRCGSHRFELTNLK